MFNRIAAKAKELEDELVQWRREIHMNPELSFEERHTTDFIESKLREFGYSEIKRGFAPVETGLTAELNSDAAGRITALRADIDALPITEAADVPWMSLREGVSHACGHDAHTAVMLAAAKILFDLRSEIKGHVRLIFQPAEERSYPGPEFKSGAAFVRDSGALEGVGMVFAMHAWGSYEAGKIFCAEGAVTGNVAAFTLKVTGKGGHGAQPHLAIDPVISSCNIAQMWQQIISREVDALDAAVLTIGKIEAGSLYNVIPETASMEGTCRSLKSATMELLGSRMRTTAALTAEAGRCRAELSFRRGHDSVRNDAAAVAAVREAAEAMFGKEAYVNVPPAMIGEDFSLLSDVVPGALFFLGMADKEKKTDRPQHDPKFKVNDEVLYRGAAMLAACAAESAVKFAQD